MTHPGGGNDNDRPVDNVEEEKERGKGNSRESIYLIGNLLSAFDHLCTVLPVGKMASQSRKVVTNLGEQPSAAKIFFTTSAAKAAVAAAAATAAFF